MALKHGLFSLALSTLLLAPAAHAEHDASVLPAAPALRDHGSRRHTPPPPAHREHRQHGRYELKAVQNWVPGRYEQVWVEGACRAHPRRRYVTRCEDGYYTQRWVPGHYETVQQWVWVPAGHGPFHRAQGRG